MTTCSSRDCNNPANRDGSYCNDCQRGDTPRRREINSVRESYERSNRERAARDAANGAFDRTWISSLTETEAEADAAVAAVIAQIGR